MIREHNAHDALLCGRGIEVRLPPPSSLGFAKTYALTLFTQVLHVRNLQRYSEDLFRATTNNDNTFRHTHSQCVHTICTEALGRVTDWHIDGRPQIRRRTPEEEAV